MDRFESIFGTSSLLELDPRNLDEVSLSVPHFELLECRGSDLNQADGGCARVRFDTL